MHPILHLTPALRPVNPSPAPLATAAPAQPLQGAAAKGVPEQRVSRRAQPDSNAGNGRLGQGIRPVKIPYNAMCFAPNGTVIPGDRPPQFRLEDGPGGALIGMYRPFDPALSAAKDSAASGAVRASADDCVAEIFEANLPLSAVARRVWPDATVTYLPYIQLQKPYFDLKSNQTHLAGQTWNTSIPVPDAALQDNFVFVEYPYFAANEKPVNVTVQYRVDTVSQNIDRLFVDRDTGNFFNFDTMRFGDGPNSRVGRERTLHFSVLEQSGLVDKISMPYVAAPTASNTAAPASTVTDMALPTATLYTNLTQVNANITFTTHGVIGQGGLGAAASLFPAAVLGLAVVAGTVLSAAKLLAGRRQRAREPQPKSTDALAAAALSMSLHAGAGPQPFVV
jgi:hypothetical protein